MIYPNEILGSLIYRTRKALNENQNYLSGLKTYKYYPSLMTDGKINLWHYSGTFNEISERYLKNQDFDSCKVKFPAIFNYQAVREDVSVDGSRSFTFNLAIVAPVDPEWKTEIRTELLWKPVLSGIYEEFLNQIRRFRPFQNFNNFALSVPHTLYRIPTTGISATENVKAIYAEYMDAYQILGLRLKTGGICASDLITIERESREVSGIKI
ncbi:MAG: hypothetical protein LBG15_03220 [Dysgonamonadaceae bacterium]|jgi:hypothetical protein|nr:hypothetical protein [Dysgonamonadaceae bacterium]